MARRIGELAGPHATPFGPGGRFVGHVGLAVAAVGGGPAFAHHALAQIVSGGVPAHGHPPAVAIALLGLALDGATAHRLAQGGGGLGAACPGFPLEGADLLGLDGVDAVDAHALALEGQGVAIDDPRDAAHGGRRRGEGEGGQQKRGQGEGADHGNLEGVRRAQCTASTPPAR